MRSMRFEIWPDKWWGKKQHKGQEQEAAHQVFIRQQRLLVLENDQSKMARQTGDSMSAGRDAMMAELEEDRKALAAHELFW